MLESISEMSELQAVRSLLLCVSESLGCVYDGMLSEWDVGGDLLRLRWGDSLRVCFTVLNAELVVECDMVHDAHMARILPPDAYEENLGEHAVFIGPYPGVVWPMDWGDARRWMSFAFGASEEPLLLYTEIMGLLRIVFDRSLPPGVESRMYYAAASY